MGFLHETAEAMRIFVVDAAAVFHFERNAAFTKRENEIDFRLFAAFGKMSHIEIGNGAQKVADAAFHDMACQVSKVG